MNKVFEIATSISTPLALSGLFATIVFYIFRQIIAKNIFPKFTSAIGAKLLDSIVKKLFILALVAMILGFVAYLAVNLLPHRLEEKSGQLKLETAVRELESTSMERRILAAAQLSNVALTNQREAENIVRVLESFINRREAIGKHQTDTQNQDISAAFASLSKILREADTRSLNVRPPEFNRVNLSSVDLTNAYLRRSSFVDSDLNDALLNGADFSNALLTGVQFSHVQAQGIKLVSARIQQSCTEDSIFDDADMSKLETSSSDFNGSSFKGANLTAANFKNTRLSFVNLDGAILTDTDLGTALELTTQQFKGAVFTDAATRPHPLFVKSKLSICKVK